MAAQYGSHLRQEDLDAMTGDDLARLAPKVPLAVTRAWLRLMVAVREIFADLDASRPLPVYSEIGLSPKVTATLLDATIDLDLTSRRLCPLGSRWVEVQDKHGRAARVKEYFAKWPEDTVFGSSRFSHCDCEACGKSIPSGRVVPVLITDKSEAVHGFYFGRDCARNILGIKDSSGDPATLAGYLATQSERFTVLTGNGAQFLNALRAGARGGILAVSAYAPALTMDVYHAQQRGDAAAADAAQSRLTPLAVEIVAKLGIAGVKAAYDAVGLKGGHVRGPLTDLPAAEVARVGQLLREAGVLVA
jgi:hypothetical protein